MTQLLNSPTARLIGRAVVVAVTVALTQIHASGGTVLWRSVLTGAILAGVEVLTPLNSVVGVFKGKPTPAAP